LIFIDIDYSKNELLGKCKIIYEEERELPREEMEKEKTWLMHLQQSAEVYNKIAEQIVENGFPDLHPINYKNSYDSYPLFTFAPITYLGIFDICCDKILGNNWANIPLKKSEGNYPKPDKTRSILMGYLNLNTRMENTRDTMKPIPVYKIFDEYYCDEGNHRLYTARLLGLPTVKAEVYEVDYASFLKKTKLLERMDQDYLGILKEDSLYYSLYPITPLQKRNYIALKNTYLE